MSDIVWDFVMLEGDIALFKVSLWILYMIRDKLPDAQDFRSFAMPAL
jgi:hypothetical protein